METNAEPITKILKEKADQMWSELSQPYLLSLAGPELKSRGIDYLAALGGERLKAFVRRTAPQSGYRLVEHPTQKAKVGIVPSGIDFQFSEAEEGAEPARPRVPGNNAQVLVAFLRALRNLPGDDLDKVIIPTRVLVRILGQK